MIGARFEVDFVPGFGLREQISQALLAGLRGALMNGHRRLPCCSTQSQIRRLPPSARCWRRARSGYNLAILLAGDFTGRQGRYGWGMTVSAFMARDR